jgi:hypothetical protein
MGKLHLFQPTLMSVNLFFFPHKQALDTKSYGITITPGLKQMQLQNSRLNHDTITIMSGVK